ncbi:hypothetical protein PVT67_07875 [Gallaecimonas kandeliae]|uniref:hypothetical protein n=1 Tax=Gallaecimonas kandeliae TaxID=3029055 RepID=UPI002647989C|nr:hypothetical protein [Gallaecimonas kandeliae]WKE67143.1 hypothetical protein PVT67_07875 [Gallaecimonas kandeliae]
MASEKDYPHNRFDRWLRLPLAVLAGLIVAASTQVLIQGIAVALYGQEPSSSNLSLGYSLLSLLGFWMATFVGVVTTLLLERREQAILAWTLVAILALLVLASVTLFAYPWWFAVAAIAGMIPLSRLAGRLAH